MIEKTVMGFDLSSTGDHTAVTMTYERYKQLLRAEEQNVRFRKGLNCDHAYNDGKHRVIWASSHCPKCAEVRKEAREA